MTDVLAIVGPRVFADVLAPMYVRDEVVAVLQVAPPDVIISGGVDGGDTYAESAAREHAAEFGVRFRSYLPSVLRWAGPGGFRDRDERMAAECTRLIGFACRWPTSHGAIYTANTAEKLGKPVRRITLPWDVTHGKVDLWDRNGDLVQLKVSDERIVGWRSPQQLDYPDRWLGQLVDDVLGGLRRQHKDRVRIRWTSTYPDVRNEAD